MNKTINIYVDEVLSHITTDSIRKDRIKNDLINHIQEASENKNIEDVLIEMGSPYEVASDFMENIYDTNAELINTLSNEKASNNSYFEYKSKISIFNLPLLHIKYRKTRNAKIARAKGIIAIGEIATGVLLGFGAISCGIFSFGILSIGLLLSVGILSIGSFSFGCISIGLYSIGAIAIGLETIGAVSLAKDVSFGAVSKAETAIGDVVNGSNTLQGNNFTLKEIADFLSANNPGKNSLMLKIIKIFM